MSVLDESPVPSGATAADALGDTVSLARAAEGLGYHRYWLAEHHNTASVAGTAPEVMVAHVAAHTSSIRVGAGGVLLPYYSPLKVAEVFRVLHALHPGRIDLGLGRADGADPPAAAALRQGRPEEGAAGYRRKVAELAAYLAGAGAGPDREPGQTDPDQGPDPAGAGGAAVRAMPGGPGAPQLWVLGSSSEGAALAGELGLPFSFAHFISPAYGVQVMATYRRSFRPSPGCPEPVASLAVSVMCAGTGPGAEALARSQAVWRLHGEGPDRAPLLPVEEAAACPLTDLQAVLLEQSRAKSVVGTPRIVRSVLADMAADFGAAEIVVRTVCHDPDDRLRSYQLLAEAFSIGGRAPD